MVNPFEQTAVSGKKRGYVKPRWTDRFSATVDKGRDIGSNMIPGIWGAGMKGLEALTEGVAMANENARWFKQNAPDTKRHAGVPMNVRESVMTGRDTDFYDKYMNLASLTDDADKRQYYLDQADTARRNLQITKRINYGMGQLNLDETPFKGYESYDKGFEGFGPQDLGPRFDIDRFRDAMSGYLPEIAAETPLEAVDRTDNWWYTPPFDEEVTEIVDPIQEAVIDDTGIEDEYVDLDEVYEWTKEGKQLETAGTTITDIVNTILDPLHRDYQEGWDSDALIKALIKKNYIRKKMKEKEFEPLIEDHEMSREASDAILYQTDNPLSFDETYDFEEYVPR